MKMFHNRTKLAALVAAPLLALAIAVINGTFTQHAVAQTPSSSRMFAVGGFTTATEHVAFAAHRISDTRPPVGHVVQEFTITGGSNSGPVNCFFASGNMAFISFHVKTGPNAGTDRTFTVVDNGEPSAMNTSPDTYTDCQQNNNCNCSGGITENVLRGNIVVSSGQ